MMIYPRSPTPALNVATLPAGKRKKKYYADMRSENEEFAVRRQAMYDEGFREFQIPFYC